MRLTMEILSGSLPTQQTVRIYEKNPKTGDDEIVCDVVLDEIAEPAIDMSVSQVWPSINKAEAE